MTPIRNRWFEGRTLSAEDLQREADYLVGHRRLAHRGVTATVSCGGWTST